MQCTHILEYKIVIIWIYAFLSELQQLETEENKIPLQL